jgi:hypothetical protein
VQCGEGGRGRIDEGLEMPTGGVAVLSTKSGPFAGGMLLTR